MKISLGTDHAGFCYKEKVKELLTSLGHEVKDFGTFNEDPVDYPVFVRPAAEAVARGECERGIVFGGSGNGEAMTANKVHGVRCALGLASASVFREDGRLFRRSAADQGWEGAAKQTIDTDDAMLKRLHTRRPFNLDGEAAVRNRLPEGLMRPILAVPIGDRLRCLALALYGPHSSGTDLNHDERSMLADLADMAASALMKLDHDELCRRIAVLEGELRGIDAKLSWIGRSSTDPSDRVPPIAT